MTTDPSRGLPTILVVDDSPHDYETYVRYLNKARPNQYRTKFFSAGRHVVSSLEEKPHCLLLDLRLPDMSGLDILEKLKEQNGGSLPFPVVMVTGSGDETTGQKAVRLGAQDYLIKEELTEDSLPRSIEFAATRFRLEQKLRASEERYRKLSTHMKLAADAAALGFWSFDVTSGAIEVDEKNRGALGLPLTGALAYKDFLSTLHEQDRPGLELAINKCIQSGAAYDEEFRVRHADGSIRWIASRGSVVRSAAGLITGMAGIAIDITERKKTQTALAESQDRLRLALNAAGMSTWDWDITSDKIEWSENLEPQLAMSRGAFPGHYAAFLDLLHPDDRSRVAESVSRTIETGADYHIEFRMSRKDGGTRWTETRGRVYLDDQRKPMRMIGVDVDITERKRAEDNLRLATERFEVALRGSTIVVFNQDLDLRYTWIHNPALGYDPLQVIGKRDIDIFERAEDGEVTEAIKRQVTVSGKSRRQEVLIHWRGVDRYYDLLVDPLIGADGKIAGVTCAAIDVTERKQAEENYRTLAESLEIEVCARTRELETRNADVLRQADELRDLSSRLLRTQDEERRHIARELHDSAGQMLAALGMSVASLIQNAAQDPSKCSEDSDETERLVQQLTREIRTMSYLLHPPLLDESGLTEALGWYVQGVRERSGLSIDLNISEDLGRLPRETELVVFRVVQECLTNIHRHSGSATAVIRIARGPNHVSVQILDEGKGMSPEKLSEIQSQGSGVGIRGMRERIRPFGGHMKVESNERGTKVSFTLPLPDLAYEDRDGREPPMRAAG
jgi:PAS domain S-box-containing protein